MTAIAQTLSGFRRPAPGEWAWSAAWAIGIFLALGTFTALWNNPFFIRMTPVTGVDYVILAAEAGLLGLFLGIRKADCPIKGATFGGVLGFQGFACTICNKLLMLAFGPVALLTWYEPYRYWVGGLGIAMLVFIVLMKLKIQTA